MEANQIDSSALKQHLASLHCSNTMNNTGTMNKQTSNPRKVAVDILADWQTGPQPIDQIRDRALAKVTFSDDRDRALVTELVYGVVRNVTEIDQKLSGIVTSPLDKMQIKLLTILRLGMYQIFYLDRIPNHAIVDESVKLAKDEFGPGAGGLVNAVLRRAAGEEPQRPVDAFDAPSGPLRNWRNHWEQNWGEEKTRELIEHFKNIPPVGLRRNLLKTESVEEWHEILKKEGVDFTTVDGWPNYVYVKRVQPGELPSFKAGITTVHDPAAGMSPYILDPQPGESILDLCSAPGGKTALIWELMQGKGSLLSVDRSMKRNKLTREGLKRLGHTDVKVQTEDAMTWKGGPFDRVLIDVPCSGSGTAHRRADLLVKRSPLQVGQMVKLQRSLLDHAREMVKVGGILVYSTCSLEPEENQKRMSFFEKKWAGSFEREEIPAVIPEAWRDEAKYAATWPPRDHVDGAFAVRWRRIA